MILGNYGYVRAAAAVPRVSVGDPAANADQIAKMIKEGAQKGVRVRVFPELAIMIHRKAPFNQSVCGCGWGAGHDTKNGGREPTGYRAARGVRQPRLTARRLSMGRDSRSGEKHFCPTRNEFASGRGSVAVGGQRVILGTDGRDRFESLTALHRGGDLRDLWAPILQKLAPCAARRQPDFEPVASDEA